MQNNKHIMTLALGLGLSSLGTEAFGYGGNNKDLEEINEKVAEVLKEVKGSKEKLEKLEQVASKVNSSQTPEKTKKNKEARNKNKNRSGKKNNKNRNNDIPSQAVNMDEGLRYDNNPSDLPDNATYNVRELDGQKDSQKNSQNTL